MIPISVVIGILVPLCLFNAYFARNAFRYMYRLVFQVFTPHTNIDGSFPGYCMVIIKRYISTGVGNIPTFRPFVFVKKKGPNKAMCPTLLKRTHIGENADLDV